MKKLILLIAVVVFLSSGMALAKELKGKVSAVKGDTVTIELKKGAAADFSVGDKVKLEGKKKDKKKKKEPAAGNDMLQGC